MAKTHYTVFTLASYVISNTASGFLTFVAVINSYAFDYSNTYQGWATLVLRGSQEFDLIILI